MLPPSQRPRLSWRSFLADRISINIELRRDTWSCGILILFALDRLTKIAAVRGASFSLGPVVFSFTEAFRILSKFSPQGRAFVIIPAATLLFGIFYKWGILRPRIWSMVFLAGLAGQGFDMLMRGSFQYCFSFSSGSGISVFNAATLYLLVGTVIGIFDMACGAVKGKN